MTDEEKEALRNFKSEYETCAHYSSDLIIELDDAEIILNLIEKQSKEIESLKEDNKKKSIVIIEYQDLYEELKDRNKELNEAIDEWVNGERIPFNCVSKDKIKAKIEEYDKFQKEITFKNHNADNINDCYRYGDKAQKALYQKEALQSLLEEKE